MKKARYLYQTKDYVYPKSFYIGCITLLDSGGKKQIVSLTRVFKNLGILRQYALFVMNDIKIMKTFGVSYEGFYIKAEFNRLFPLKKEYWSKKNRIKINLLQDFRKDVNIIKYWKMSEILVTPDGQIGGNDYFSFGTSLFKDTPVKDIELYIKNLNLIVDTCAKNAAFYTLEKPVKISWLENHNNKTESISLKTYKN